MLYCNAWKYGFHVTESNGRKSRRADVYCSLHYVDLMSSKHVEDECFASSPVSSRVRDSTVLGGCLLIGS